MYWDKTGLKWVPKDIFAPSYGTFKIRLFFEHDMKGVESFQKGCQVHLFDVLIRTLPNDAIEQRR